jgi:integrator complex subunit 3
MSQRSFSPLSLGSLDRRITPEMETQLLFIMTQVMLGNQRRYQTWFVQRFIPTVGTCSLPCAVVNARLRFVALRAESGSIVSDLIRFICGCYHPPNHVIASNVMPRWAMLGWLIKTVRVSHSLSLLSLFPSFAALYRSVMFFFLCATEPCVCGQRQTCDRV